MRAGYTSLARSFVVAKVCVVWVTRLSTENCTSGVPKYPSRMVETAPVTQPCAAGYSGWAGVAPKGVHVGSPVSCGLPPPARIAVTGRQKLNVYLAFQQPMTESA